MASDKDLISIVEFISQVGCSLLTNTFDRKFCEFKIIYEKRDDEFFDRIHTHVEFDLSDDFSKYVYKIKIYPAKGLEFNRAVLKCFLFDKKGNVEISKLFTDMLSNETWKNLQDKIFNIEHQTEIPAR